MTLIVWIWYCGYINCCNVQ